MKPTWVAWLAVASVLGCGDTTNVTYYIQPDAGPSDEDGADPGDGEPQGSDGDAGEPETDAGGPLVLGGLTVDTTPAEQTIDLFAHSGHRFWMQVSDEQLEQMNEDRHDNGPWFPLKRAPKAYLLPYKPHSDASVQIGLPGGDIGGGGADVPPPPFPGGGPVDVDAGTGGWNPLPEEDPYDPGGAGGGGTYVDHMVVQDVVSGSVADYGKIKVRLVGESTGRDWTGDTIPNLRIDTDAFTENLRLGGFEHIRLNNGQVGTIFREGISHRVYRAMGYPGLRSSWAFLGSNVWGEEAWIPMTLIEVYKLRFCDDNQDLVGGTCVNMWEFPGDAAYEMPQCQVSQCDNAKLTQLRELVASTPAGAGFKTALADLIDWDRYHQFQCLSWIMWTGDDAIHYGNNNLIVERDDGKLVWAPYSIDISAGQNWYLDTSLFGQTAIASGCQQDPECWADTIATCEELIQKFDDLNPETFVDDAVATLMEHGMMRDGDVERAQNIRDWFVWRQENLRDELTLYLYPPGSECPEGLERCQDDTCGTPEQCDERRCLKGEQWCESTQSCYIPGIGFCPECDEVTPYYCASMDACYADVVACGEATCAQGGEVYCPDNGGCAATPEQCSVIIIDPEPEPEPR